MPHRDEEVELSALWPSTDFLISKNLRHSSITATQVCCGNVFKDSEIYNNLLGIVATVWPKRLAFYHTLYFVPQCLQRPQNLPFWSQQCFLTIASGCFFALEFHGLVRSPLTPIVCEVSMTGTSRSGYPLAFSAFGVISPNEDMIYPEKALFIFEMWQSKLSRRLPYTWVSFTRACICPCGLE